MNDGCHDNDKIAGEAGRAEDGTFAKGASGNLAGRPLGARTRFSESFMQDVLAEWQEHGRQALIDFREGNAENFVKLMASLLPKNVNLKVNELDDLTDEQLMRQLAAVRQDLARAGIDPLAGADGPQAPGSTLLLPALSEAG